MVTITIRDVPQDVRDELASRAAGSGRSLQEYLAAALREIAARPSLESAVVEVRQRARGLPELEVGDVLADLAADRR
jgi:plasmid stability protein